MTTTAREPLRRCALVGALIAALLASSCSDPPDARSSGESTTSQTPANAGPLDSGRDALKPLTAPMSFANLRWAKSNVPRAVPSDTDELRELTEDPPGRALVASYTPKPEGGGWTNETIELFGADGYWRRLHLEDLGLPPDGWHGYDTYGAGALSPNGRWWLGSMLGGFLIVDLRDASVRTHFLTRKRSGTTSFAWSPDGDEFVVVLAGISSRVTMPGLTVTSFPEDKERHYPQLFADGSYVVCPSQQKTTTTCSIRAADGAPESTTQLPADLTRKWSWPGDFVGDTVRFSVAANPYGNYRADWEVVLVDATDYRATARLVLPKGSAINGFMQAFSEDTWGLAAIDDRMLLAWLAGDQEIVRLFRPGPNLPGVYDAWDVSFATDLVRIS